MDYTYPKVAMDYTYPKIAKTQLINEERINNTLNCEAYSYFEGVFSDHKIVKAKIRLSLRRNEKKKIQTVKITRYDWSSLTRRDISN